MVICFMHLCKSCYLLQGTVFVVYMFENSWSSSREEGSKRPRQDQLSEAEAATMFDQLMEGFGLRRKRRSKDVRYSIP